MSEKEGTLKALVWRISSIVEQAVRIVVMQFILAPAAYVLPRNPAMAVADAVSLILLILPSPGFIAYWKMRIAFGKSRSGSLGLARAWIARPLRDFIVTKRVLTGRETRSDNKVIELNSGPIRSLRESGESYIIVCGHFSREAVGKLYSPDITPGHLVVVSEALPEHCGNLHDIRTRLQLGSLLKATSAVHSGNNTFIYTRSRQPASGEIYSKLLKPGNAVVINIDAPVSGDERGFVQRAFAGHKKRTFAMGAVKLARLSGCAMIGCVCYLKKDGTTVIEWGDATRLSKDRTKSEDILEMEKLLNSIELAIGRRPDQYVLDIGRERRWDAQSEEWIDL